MSARPARRVAAGALAVVALTGGLLAASPAQAKDGRIGKSGACDPSGRWKLEASPENGKIEVEYEIDAKSGQRWRVVIKDDGITRLDATRKTVAGSVEFRVVMPDRRGTDTITAKATNLVTGATCGGRIDY